MQIVSLFKDCEVSTSNPSTVAGRFKMSLFLDIFNSFRLHLKSWLNLISLFGYFTVIPIQWYIARSQCLNRWRPLRQCTFLPTLGPTGKSSCSAAFLSHVTSHLLAGLSKMCQRPAHRYKNHLCFYIQAYTSTVTDHYCLQDSSSTPAKTSQNKNVTKIQRTYAGSCFLP